MALFRGAGGVEWEIEPPREGTPQRERFDQQVANGDLTPVDAGETPAPRKRPSKAAPKTDDA